MFFLYMINYKTDVQCRLWGSVIMIACQYYSAIMLVISLFLRPFVVSFGVSPVPQLLCIKQPCVSSRHPAPREAMLSR